MVIPSVIISSLQHFLQITQSGSFDGALDHGGVEWTACWSGGLEPETLAKAMMVAVVMTVMVDMAEMVAGHCS